MFREMKNRRLMKSPLKEELEKSLKVQGVRKLMRKRLEREGY